MSSILSKLRLIVIGLIFLGLIAPFAPAASAAQATECADFETQEDAQAALDDDPDLADELDQDDDGEACNEDGNVTAEDVSLPEDEDDEPAPDEDEATEEPTEEPEEATEEPADDEAVSEEGTEYLSTVQDEVDDLESQVEDFKDAVEIATDEDASSADQRDAEDQLDDLAADFVDYPDVAAEIEAPEGFESVDEIYQELAAEIGGLGTNWQAFIEADPGSEEADEAQQAYEDNLDAIDEQIPLLNDQLTEAESEPATDDEVSGDEATGDEEDLDAEAEEYLTTVRENYDELDESVDTFNDLLESAATGSEVSTEDAFEVLDIMDLWAESEDIATALDAPAEYAEIQELYEEYTGYLADAAEAFDTIMFADADSSEYNRALSDFQFAFFEADRIGVDLGDALDDAGV